MAGWGAVTSYIMHYVYNSTLAGSGAGGHNLGLATAATLLVAVVLIIFTVVQRMISSSDKEDYAHRE
jgi:ABC-type sugar transport system permease subunit